MKTSKLLRKSSIVLLKTALGTLILIGLFGIFYWYNNRLFLWEASFIWQKEAFSETKFKNGSTDDRARMVVDLIRRKIFIGVDSDQIQARLGKETGDYYHSDSNSTYRLTDRGNADWILTFVSGDDGKIQKVFIRKSCCSISKKIVLATMKILDPQIK